MIMRKSHYYLIFISLLFSSCYRETYSLDNTSYNTDKALIVFDESGWFSTLMLVCIFIALIAIYKKLDKIFKEIEKENIRKRSK